MGDLSKRSCPCIPLVNQTRYPVSWVRGDCAWVYLFIRIDEHSPCTHTTIQKEARIEKEVHLEMEHRRVNHDDKLRHSFLTTNVMCRWIHMIDQHCRISPSFVCFLFYDMKVDDYAFHRMLLSCFLINTTLISARGPHETKNSHSRLTDRSCSSQSDGRRREENCHLRIQLALAEDDPEQHIHTSTFRTSAKLCCSRW